MPTSPETSIQNTAPGPPAAIAVATPAMLPTPTVPPIATAMAWNGVTSPSARGPRWTILPIVSRHIRPNFQNWIPRARSVRNTPVPTSRISIGGPHTCSLICLFAPSSASTIGHSEAPRDPYHSNSVSIIRLSQRVRAPERRRMR